MRERGASGPEQLRRMDSAEISSVRGRGAEDVDHVRRDVEPELTHPRKAWDAALEHASPAELVRIGYEAATEHNRFDVAEMAWRRSAGYGEVLAMLNLAVLLESRGEQVEAEQWFRSAAEHDDVGAMANLAVLLENGEEEEFEAEEWYRRAPGEPLALPQDALAGDQRDDTLRVKLSAPGCSLGTESGSVVGSDSDQSSDKYSFLVLGLMFAVGLLSGALGGLFAVHKLRDEPPAPAAPSAATSSMRPAVAPPCRDNLPQFVHTVRGIVDPDGDELHGVDDVSLGRLGKLALKQPSVLEDTNLVPFQRTRFLEAANQWLCPYHSLSSTSSQHF